MTYILLKCQPKMILKKFQKKNNEKVFNPYCNCHKRICSGVKRNGKGKLALQSFLSFVFLNLFLNCYFKCLISLSSL